MNRRHLRLVVVNGEITDDYAEELDRLHVLFGDRLPILRWPFEDVG